MCRGIIGGTMVPTCARLLSRRPAAAALTQSALISDGIWSRSIPQRLPPLNTSIPGSVRSNLLRFGPAAQTDGIGSRGSGFAPQDPPQAGSGLIPRPRPGPARRPAPPPIAGERAVSTTSVGRVGCGLGVISGGRAGAVARPMSGEGDLGRTPGTSRGRRTVSSWRCGRATLVAGPARGWSGRRFVAGPRGGRSRRRPGRARPGRGRRW
jgi:hypothetical protein